jgi:type II secretory pathway component GspD/PulD (secretin)
MEQNHRSNKSILRLSSLLTLVLLGLIYAYSVHAQEPRFIREPIVVRVLQLDYADAEQLASVLAPFLSKEGQIVPYRPTNCLIIKDRKSVVEALVKIIKGNSKSLNGDDF